MAKTNDILELMLAKIHLAKAKKEKQVVVFMTTNEHYKKVMGSPLGFSDNDLKPKYHKAYIALLRDYNLVTKLINPSEKEVEWVVILKGKKLR